MQPVLWFSNKMHFLSTYKFVKFTFKPLFEVVGIYI